MISFILHLCQAFTSLFRLLCSSKEFDYFSDHWRRSITIIYRINSVLFLLLIGKGLHYYSCFCGRVWLHFAYMKRLRLDHCTSDFDILSKWSLIFMYQAHTFPSNLFDFIITKWGENICCTTIILLLFRLVQVNVLYRLCVTLFCPF